MAQSFQFDLINAYSNNRSMYTEQIAAGNTLAQTLRLEIENISGSTINFDALGGDPGKGNYHFALFFRGGVLSTYSALNAGIKSGSDCRMSRAVAGGVVGSYYFYFIYDKPSLAQGKILSVDLQSFLAEDRNSDFVTELSLDFQNLTDSGGNPISTSAKSDLTVENSLVNRRLPLQFSFRDHDTVLNDGVAANSLTLMVANMSVPEDESLKAAGNIVFDQNSRVSIGFDVQLQGQTKDWALGTDDNIKNCQVGFPSGWAQKEQVTVTDEGKISWSFAPADPNSPITLGSLQEMVVTVTGIQTNLISGFTNLYFSYQNVPNYGNGEFRIPILKTPLVTRGNQVGIGKSPGVTLDINGKGDATIELSVNGRIESKGDYGGIWTGPGKFVGANFNNLGLNNNGFHLEIEPGGKTWINHDLEVKGSLTADGAATMQSSLTVNGATTLNNSLTVTGASALNSLTVSNHATVGNGSNNGADVQFSVNGRLESTGNAGGIWVGTGRFMGANGNNIGLFNNGFNLELEPGGKTLVHQGLEVSGDLKVNNNLAFNTAPILYKVISIGSTDEGNHNEYFAQNMGVSANDYVGIVAGYFITGWDTRDTRNKHDVYMYVDDSGGTGTLWFSAQFPADQQGITLKAYLIFIPKAWTRGF